MAKGEAKKTNKYIDQERDFANRQYGGIDNALMGRLSGAQQRGDQAYNAAYGGYNDLLGRIRSGSGGSGNYSEIANRFKAFGDSGGIDDEGKARIRGNGVFDEFARTGGLSEGDKANLRARSTATLPSFYDQLSNELSRGKAVQGGYSPGYDAQAAALARDKAYGANRVAAEAEGDIVDRVTAGRQWGAGSLSSAEQGLQGLLSNNKLSAWSNALAAMQAGDDSNFRNMQGELGALEGLRGLRTDQPGEEFGIYDRLLGSAGQRGGQAGNNLNLRAQYNPNKSFMDHLTEFAGVAAPIAASFMMPGAGAAAAGAQKIQKLPAQRNLWGSIYG